MPRRSDPVAEPPPVRLFVAVDPPAGPAAHLGSLVDSLVVSRANAPGHSTRLADRAHWHVTLAFIGEVPADRVEVAAGAVASAAETVPGPIRVRFAGGGRFGRGRFTILWAALGGDLPVLGALADGVRTALRRARIPYDRKPFRPHLTLARPGDRLSAAEVQADLAGLAGYEGPEWTVDRVYLYRSELGPRPVYTRLAEAALPVGD